MGKGSIQNEIEQAIERERKTQRAIEEAKQRGRERSALQDLLYDSNNIASILNNNPQVHKELNERAAAKNEDASKIAGTVEEAKRKLATNNDYGHYLGEQMLVRNDIADREHTNRLIRSAVSSPSNESVNGSLSEESQSKDGGNTRHNNTTAPTVKSTPVLKQPVQPTVLPQPAYQQAAQTQYAPSVQTMNGIKVAKLPTHQDAYQSQKTVQVTPEKTTKTTTYGLPDAQMLQYIQDNIIKPAQRAYGVNPQTGTLTPFEVLGYDPEEERKRREEERALNDAKRKENAWYNAFAVLGDSLTAALGGNVWQRQPNNIGAKAIADNERMIAEQKAEDEANQAKMRNAGTAYADTVNKLIQNYLTKTTTTDKTGGDRLETTMHPEKNGYRYVSVPEKQNNNGSGRGSGRGSNSDKYVNINVTNTDGSTKKNRYEVTKEQYKALQGILKEHYNKILSRNDDQARQLENALTNSHVITGMDSRGQYIYDMDQLLQNGKYWMLDDATMDRIEKEIGGKAKFKRPESNENSNNGWGHVPDTAEKDSLDFSFVTV